MLYASYKDNRIYSGQNQITFPRTDSEERTGYGNCIILVTPNRHLSIEALSSPKYAFTTSLIKRYFSDAIFREKIGRKKVISLERSSTDSFYISTNREIPMKYIPYASRKSLLRNGKSCVYDISRWMELFFSRTDDLQAKKKCAEFIRILASRINDSSISDYEKLLLIDLNSWTASSRQCVIMNRKLLNNPLSILFYSAIYYPDLLDQLPNIRIMIANRTSGQLYLIHKDFITKRNYPKIKSKLLQFKDLVFSVEDEVSETVAEDEAVDKEVKAEVITSFKEDMKRSLQRNLLGNTKEKDDPFNFVTDITDEITDDDLEIEKELAEAEAESEEESSAEDEIINNINDSIEQELTQTLGFVDTLEDLDDIDTDKEIAEITKRVKETVYHESFTPVRSEKEKARIERLTQDQESVIQPISIEDVKRKTLKTVPTGSYIRTTNPTIIDSKFKNFDQEYTDKCLQRNIDSAVTILSKASDKVFVAEKTVEDSSDSMNLQELYTYKLVDEKGNRYVLQFDVPKIIDGSYVYLNGTKKIIKHQLILKPIVKTGNDTVQIVTSYNKVFIRRQGVINQNSNKLYTFLSKNKDKYKVRDGNCSMLNNDYDVPLDFAMLSKYVSSFEIGDCTFYMTINSGKQAYQNLTKKNILDDKNYNEATDLLIGINRKTKEPIIMKLTDSYIDTVLSYMSEEDRKNIAKIKRKPRFVSCNAKILGRDLPLIFFMMYCEGFSSVMKKANIEYEFVDKKVVRKYDPLNWDTIELNDGFIVWKKVPFRNELLMNGFKRVDMSDFNYSDLEDKDTFVSIIAAFYPGNNKFNFALDNYRDFLIDDKSAEILTDFGYPTDLVSLLVVAAGMLTDNHFKIENNLENMRVRSNEVISDLVYKAVTDAYTPYRNTSHKKKPSRISCKRSIIKDTLLSSDTNMIEEFSSLNPVLELEKQRSVTFKGLRGIQMARAMTLPRRCYDPSMTGTLAITSSPDANIGVNRTLTLEPAITSTYGYIDTEKSKDLNGLNAANLFSATELLNPMGAQHDDPDRSSMNVKFTKYMVPVKDSDPVLIGNKMEEIIPYYLSNEFVVAAKEDGKVVEIDQDYCIIEYKSGVRTAIDLSHQPKKNAAAGFWLDNALISDLKVGDKFKEGDILAYNPYHFTPSIDEKKRVSMNLGVLCKVAISSQWDVFEDSAPISRNLSKKLATEMIDEKHVTLTPFTEVSYIVKPGDKIKTGEPLIVFSEAADAEDRKLLSKLREETQSSILETAKTTISSKYTGEIADVRIYTTTPIEDLDPSLQKILKEYWNKISKRNAVLDRNKNPGDLNYYKAGQVISEVAEVVDPSGYTGKVQGYQVNEGDVLFLFYIKYNVEASKGKNCPMYTVMCACYWVNCR